MPDEHRRYLRSMIFGLVLTLAGAVLWFYCGPVFLPALPGVRVPTAPFLLLAGLVLSAVSFLLYRNSGK